MRIYLVPLDRWYIERAVWLIAGIVLLSSTALAALVDPRFIVFVAITGLTSIWVSLTGLCPVGNVLHFFGLRGRLADPARPGHYVMRTDSWYLERRIYPTVGTNITLASVLSLVHSPWWLAFTGFVGVAMVWFAFTGFCILANGLYWIGAEPRLAPETPEHAGRPAPAGSSARRFRFLLLLLPFAIVLACEQKSPAGPTPPPVTCTYTLSANAMSFGAAGGTGSVTVTTEASCAWTAASDRGWMTIGSGASGSGPGSVTVSLTANPGTESRAGTLTVAGQAVAVRQDGATPCTVSVSPGSAAFTKDAATGTFTVTAPASCAWSAASSDAWITITSGASATGTAAVTYAISRNTSESARTGSIHVGGAAFSIAQQGDTPAPACDFHVSPVLINACMAVPYELSVTMATGPSCGWTVASDTPWISMSGPASRSGPGELRFRVGDNYDAPRLGVVKVRWDTPTAGQNLQVSQAGCRYALSATSRTVPSAGGAFSVDVYQQSDPYECGGPLQNGCVWSAAADVPWITITTPMPQAGDGRVNFTAAANGGAARTGRVTVRDKVLVVTQDAR